MEYYENWAEEESEYYGWCRRHPSQPRHAVCAACLHERLSQLCPNCARPRPCRVCEPSSSFFSAASSAVFDVASSSSATSSEHSVSADTADGGVAIGSVAPMSHFLGEPYFRRSRSAACGRMPPVTQPTSNQKQLEPAEEEIIEEPRSSLSSSTSSFLFLFKRSSRSSDKMDKVKKVSESKEKPVEGLYRSRTVAAGRGSCQREVAAEMKGRGWLRSPMKAFRLPKSEKMLHPRPPLCRG